MARDRKTSKEHKKLDKLSTKNAYGFADYTPYNAITGQNIMSKSVLSIPNQRVHGSFNG